ncbi:MAG: response regulator transcription factor [Cytophagales bacterium]|jgi:DNA-binding LytR/AlgR family response regulator|nr:response regulator transcription factor [Cytophagales bacterium]MCA6389352.1 response regulator transcription factor [Cytophagales bacterium]MCA6393491.1 response regulator transcription factor [Cytophagales bacterium]MCA6396095.1 response regulator transcription factor [Cytophagales bacterium]MCA6403349.1 response regulator transcription factor [Cytophagales bacterium]
MNKAKVLIVDDEPLAQKVLQRFISLVDSLELVGLCSNAIEASNALRNQPVDLLFLDIRMPELSGLDLLKIIKNPPKVILTTAYAEHALEGYEFGVIDYLVKPIAFDRFLRAINKVVPTLQANTPPLMPTPVLKLSNYLFVKSDRKIYKIDYPEIKYVEAFGNYVKIHTTHKIVLAQETLTNLEKSLPAEHFLRIHKSYIVSIHFINLVDGNSLFVENVELPIGQLYKQRVYEMLKI